MRLVLLLLLTLGGCDNGRAWCRESAQVISPFGMASVSCHPTARLSVQQMAGEVVGTCTCPRDAGAP